MAATTAATAWLAAANVEEGRLREAIQRLLPDEDIKTTTIGGLRGKLESSMELNQGALDGCKAEVNRILQDELMAYIQAKGGEDVEEYDRSHNHRKNKKRKTKEYPVVDFDTPLAKLPTLGLSVDSTSEETDEEDREARKKRKAEKKARFLAKMEKYKSGSFGRQLANRPTPLSKKRKNWKALEKEERQEKQLAAENSKNDMLENARAQKQAKILEAVEKYVAEHPNWTASTLREDLSEQHGWENNNEFVSLVKGALVDLGIGNGANVIKGTYH